MDDEAYARSKAADPNHAAGANTLAYGTAGAKVPAENVDRMVAELEAQKRKRAEFSRRRVHREAKDVTHINDRNEHFNKKLDRAYGDHTAEIKANLSAERRCRTADGSFEVSSGDATAAKTAYSRSL